MNITKPTEKLSAAAEIDAVALRPSTAFPANGQAKKPQPQRRWLAAMFTAFALLLAAGGAQAQAPMVSSVSAVQPSGPVGIGGTVDITVTFDQSVNVIGTPTLLMRVGNTDITPGNNAAPYTGGTGSNMLVFVYTVRTGDNTPSLDYDGNNALKLSGGTIRNAAGDHATLLMPPVDGSISDHAHATHHIGRHRPDRPEFYRPGSNCWPRQHHQRGRTSRRRGPHRQH